MLMAAIGPSGPGPSGNCGRGVVWDSGHLPPAQPLPHNSALTLALPAPGPMGFMMVYMFSLELVESGEDDA